MQKNKKIFYIFLSVMSVVMIAMAIVSFLGSEPRYTISNGIIFVFVAIAILLVFDSIESLSIGNVLSLKTKVKEKEKEVDKLNAENVQLRNQFISVMTTTFRNNSSNQVYVGFPADYRVQNADGQDADEEEISATENEQQRSADNDAGERNFNYTDRRMINSNLKELLIRRFKEENNIADIDLRREVKIANVGNISDPITEKDIVYDAYIRRPMDEIFIEISISTIPSLTFDYRLYFMISRIYYYSQVNKVKSKMILVFPKYTDSYVEKNPGRFRSSSSDDFVKRLHEMYAPAIQNELLEIVEINVTDEEMADIESKVKESSK